MNKSTEIKIKYFVDRVCSILLIALLCPLFLLIGIAIKLDDGNSIFYRQRRPGLKGKVFTVWKFRTMIPNADSLLDERGSVNGVNRITRVGKILRYLSLDELPQLINIVKEEMSFIGPRPGLFDHFRKYTPEQKSRVKMKPGITGLAQVNGRNLLKWSKRIEYDLQYIEHYSLLLDLKILLKTVKVVLLREGISLDRNPEFADDLARDKSNKRT